MFNRKEYKAAFSKVTASQEVYERIMEMQNAKPVKRKTGLGSKILIAAVLASLFAITASASESSWFTKFFSARNELSQEQVMYLEEKTQKIEAEPNAQKEAPQNGHRDVLQFVRDMTVCSADQNNTHITEEGEPSLCDIKVETLTLSETEARLEYYYNEGTDTQASCSMENITVVLSSGGEVVLPITESSSRRMIFAASEPLDLYAVAYIRLPDGLILYPVNKVDDGYALSIDSVITDGNTAYVTLNVTIPESIPTYGEGWVQDGYPGIAGASSWYMPAEQEKITTEQRVRNRVTEQFIDDGDGKDTTGKIIVTMSTWDVKENQFVSGSKWTLHIGGFECHYHHPENQKAVDEKYAGQDYLIDGEEAAQVIAYQQVCWDTWDFEITFEEEETAIEEIEFISEPISLSGRRATTINEIMSGIEDEYLPMDAELVSFRISPLSYFVEYAADEPKLTGTFDPGMYTLVMIDGTEIELYPYNGRHSFDEPIILKNIDYLLLPNGQKLSVPE